MSHTVRDLDKGQLDLMWEFLRRNQKPNISILKKIVKCCGRKWFRKQENSVKIIYCKLYNNWNNVLIFIGSIRQNRGGKQWENNY